MEHVLVERTFAEPVTFEQVQALEDRSAWCFRLHEVTFVHSWMSRDRRRMVCVYRARDAESVRLANEKAGLPFDRVWSASLHEPHAPRVRFHRYQALGNDYVLLEGLSPDRLDAAFARRVCDRHFGVGSDGILVESPARAEASFGLRIFNPDGSEAEKSGNGLRIFARHLHEQGRIGAAPFTVSTAGGVVRCRVDDAGETISVEMGRATFDAERVPVAGARGEVVDRPLDVGGEALRFTAVTVGNPHCVVIVPAASRALAERLGPVLERHALFPNRTNVQFASPVGRHRLRVEIWERGAGYTLASGSSACAAAAAAVRLGLVESPVTVEMPGGALRIDVAPDGAVVLHGPARKICDGTLAADLLADRPPGPT